MPVVDLDRISKSYSNKVAVRELSLRIEKGTMFGLLGPNGAGKTSTIRMMVVMTLPDSGTVRLFDEPFRRDMLARIGYLPEERGLYKRMKVIDQLIFMGQLHGLQALTAKARARQWCERMEIGESMEKKTQELSKGMQQKIQFIATLLHDPELIIMDEPSSGLDPVNVSLLEQTLLESLRTGDSGGFLMLDPMYAERLALEAARVAEQVEQTGDHPGLVCAQPLRLPVRRLVESAATRLPVLSYAELGGQLSIIPVGVVNVVHAPAA